MIAIARPTISTTGSFRAVDPRQVDPLLRAAAGCLLIAGVLAQDPIAYMCVTVPILVSPIIWVSSGAYGIPVLPVISALFYLFYAMPMFTGSTLTLFKTDDLIWAALSVGLFLLAASLAAWPFLGPARTHAKPVVRSRTLRYATSLRAKSFSNLASSDQLFRLIFIGLAGGILYHLVLLSGSGGFLGSYLGVVRAGILPLASVACYLVGFARGVGALTGERWLLALAGFVAITLLSMGGLFLVGGVINIVGAMLGYVLAAKRIPWRGIGLTLAVVSVFNAGKYSMRAAYWAPDSQSVQNSSVLKLPSMLAGWFVAGLDSIASVGDGRTARQRAPSLLERTSLLHMVLTVQAATPKFIPYLDGETYALLPSMLVPRFLKPDKIESQAALNLLSVRYGLETADNTSKTTIGWGLVAEAYANFGDLGVIAVGALFGTLCGALMRLSTTAAPVSLAMLITIASTLTLSNVEFDFCSLVVTLLQTIAGILFFTLLPRLVRRRQAPVGHYIS